MKISRAACLAVCLVMATRVLIAAPADDGAKLVGAWRLVSWEARLADGSIRRNPMSTGSLIRERWFMFDDAGRLMLRIDPAENGPNIVESRLIWERVSR
jgi:hypothetical protein